MVAIPVELRDKIASAAEITNCNGCERDFALEAGADCAAWGTVQKVSNLILNINASPAGSPSSKVRIGRRGVQEGSQLLGQRLDS